MIGVREMLDSLRGDVVFDMDEVLVDIFPRVFEHIHDNRDRYMPYIDPDLRGLTRSDARSINKIREHHDLRVFLMADQFRSMPAESIHDIVEDMRMMPADREMWEGNIYAGLTPTSLGRMAMEDSFIDRDDIASVTILTFSSGEKLNEAKARFVRMYFDHPKIRLIPVMGFGARRVRKSDAAKDMGIHWDAFVDDMVYNIEDFAENFGNIYGRRFFMPDFSYNSVPEELLRKIESRGASLARYVP